jgi:hypothetical protein
VPNSLIFDFHLLPLVVHFLVQIYLSEICDIYFKIFPKINTRNKWKTSHEMCSIAHGHGEFIGRVVNLAQGMIFLVGPIFNFCMLLSILYFLLSEDIQMGKNKHA